MGNKPSHADEGINPHDQQFKENVLLNQQNAELSSNSAHTPLRISLNQQPPAKPIPISSANQSVGDVSSIHDDEQSTQQQQQHTDPPIQADHPQASEPSQNQPTSGIPDDLNPPQNMTDVKISTSLTADDFELISVIGKGSFGKVLLVKKKSNGKSYAMKILKKDHIIKRKQVAHTQTERRILQNISHPFIVSLKYAFQTPEKLYLVLDYFNGGELFYHLKANGRFSEHLACFYTAELVLALFCLHNNNIVYRDLKPENILLDRDGHIRLTDFGLSKEISPDGVITTFCGTPEYLAPEVISARGYNKEVDFWSLGTLLYEMITGLPPFFNTNINVMYERIMTAQLVFPEWMSPQAVSFISGLLCRNPAHRLGSGPNGQRDIISHPFFANINWRALYNKQIVPPFRPHTTCETDTANIDDEFKNELVADTPVTSTNPLGSATGGVNFVDFSYQSTDSSLDMNQPQNHHNTTGTGAAGVAPQHPQQQQQQQQQGQGQGQPTTGI